MKRILFSALLLTLSMGVGYAQRMTDKLDRGVVAVPANGGNFVSWRIMGEEYYDTEYNLYRDGVKVNASPLKVSNYSDTKGTASSQYQVAAVVRGVEQEKSAAVTRWSNQYFDVPMPPAYDRTGAVVSNDNATGYALNDVSLADVTGDGVIEFIVKRNYQGGVNNASNTTRFNHYECVNMKGERLWWIDLGPNLMAGPDEQWDLIAYDWDEDGKAECVMRGADNMIIHTATGKSIKVGDMNYVAPRDQYTCNGAEYLLYLNGETGEPYAWDGTSENFTPMAYPLPRFEVGESDYGAVWGKAGDGGHRSSKHYFAAPVLDGRRASIFLGRGCYTQHKMCALDVNPETHELTQRWRWNDLGGQWFGQGYHNFGIADVDLDGRDEIVFGSMVIDDNGKGLSTTGLGHGDAQHTGDLDPYRWGLELFACNESSPSMNYRNATTAKIYYRLQSTSDDGRALCGNFTNSYPGSVGRSTQTGMISSVADKPITELGDFIAWSDLNFRIYWDGDLLSEVLNSPGTEREAKIEKPGTGRIFTSSGCKMNNDSKNNPGATGDIIGDWREEMVLRTGDNSNLRIYTTSTPTTHRIYTLWHDHQYRQAMVWQCIGYNQPPHLSYFIGELEGLTVAPPPLINEGRTEVKSGETISSAHADKHVMVCETGNTEITVAEDAKPYIVTFNVPSWVKGSNNNNGIKYEYYTSTVTGAAFTGNMRLVKQGDGILTLPPVEQTYIGETNIWAGTLNFDGKLTNSPLWLNRFAKLNSNGGSFKSVRMDYAAELRPGGSDSKGEVTINLLQLGFGSRIVFDIYNEGFLADQLNVTALSVENKNWTYGPEYLTPVFEFVTHLTGGEEMAEGEYLLGTLSTVSSGSLSDIRLEGISSGKKHYLKHEGGKLYLVVEGLRDAASVVWNGLAGSVWDLAATQNFTMADDAKVTDAIFVTGDKVRFDDTAESFNVSLEGEIETDTLVVDNTSAYTFKGAGKLTGATTLVKRGKGTLTIQTDNDYTGGTRISGGTVNVASLSNANQATGNLGAVNVLGTKFVIENGAVLKTTAAVQMGSPIKLETPEGGVVNNSADFVMNKVFYGTKLTKKGNGWLKLNTANSSLDTLVIDAGTVQSVACNVPAKNVVFNSGELTENTGTSYTIHVPAGKSGVWRTASNATYSNVIKGEGTLTAYCNLQKGNGWYATRTPLKLDLSAFKGTFVPQCAYSDDGRFTLDVAGGMPHGTMKIPAGIEVQNSGKVFTIGQLDGEGSLGGTCTFSQSASSAVNTWRIGNDDNYSWKGKVVGSGVNVTKIGKGRLTLSGASTFTGKMLVDDGVVMVSAGAQLGTGQLTVSADATLGGVTESTKVKTPLTNSAYTINGTLAPGISLGISTTGTMDFGGKNVTFGAASVYDMAINRCATATNTGGTLIKGIASLRMNGTVKVRLSSTYTPAEGDSIKLWEASSFMGTPKFDLPELPLGYSWNTSRVAAPEGWLTIDYDPTGIAAIAQDEEVEVTVVSMSGMQAGTFTCPMGAVESTFHKLVTERGVYILDIKGCTNSGVMKLMK